jgi:hypothetical protein
MLNVAVAVKLLFIVTVQELVPLHAPLHPAKYPPLVATAVSFTFVPEANEALHVGEQLIPDGLLVTVPVLVPASVIVSV